MKNKKKDIPWILILDVETAPLVVLTFGLFDQNIGLDGILQDTFILSWSAKWLQDVNGKVYGPHNKIMYSDQRNNKKIDKNCPKLLKEIWDLMDKSDIILGQNSKRFDVPMLNAAFVQAELTPPSSFKQIDTLSIARKAFKFTSNKLAYTTDKLCKKYKKLTHSKYPGIKLWKECLNGNKDAFKEMEKYNCHDVLSTEEYFQIIQSWDTSAINLNIYHNDYHHKCRCGSLNLIRNGYAYTTTGKYIRYKCKSCGAESRDAQNLLTKEKRASLKRKV